MFYNVFTLNKLVSVVAANSVFGQIRGRRTIKLGLVLLNILKGLRDFILFYNCKFKY